MENNFSNMKAPEPLNLKKSRFTIDDSATAIVLFIVLQILFIEILSIFNVSVYEGSIGHHLLQVAVEALFVLAGFMIVKYRKLNFVADTGMKNKISWKMAGWCALVSLVSIIFLGELTNVFVAFLELLGYKSPNTPIVINNFFQYFLSVVSLCASAAFCEEFLFRGVILSGFRKYGAKITILASAFIFMIMHGNASQTIHQFIVGVIVGVAFYKTGNLWIGVLIHFFNNLIPVTLTYYINTSYTEVAAAEAETIGFGSLLISFGIALLSVWVGYEMIKWIFKRIYAENNRLNGEYELVGQKTSVVIDGQETTVDMTIDGESVEAVAEGTTEENKVEPMNRATLIMFVISGIYLIGSWIIDTVSRFL